MFGTLKGRLFVILAVLLASGFYLWKNGLKQGLDLQGGMHLVLEVADPEGTMTPEAKIDATDRALKIIRTRVDAFGVEEPNIHKSGSDRIVVELAGVRDEDRAKEVIQRSAFLEFKLVATENDLRSALPRMDRVLAAALGPEAASAAETPAESAEPAGRSVQDLLFNQRADTAAQAADSAAALGADSLTTPAGGPRPLSSLMQEAGGGTFVVAEGDVGRVSGYLAMPEVKRLIPRDVTLHWASEPEGGSDADLYRRLYVLSAEEFMTGENLEDATAGRDQQFGQTIVSFQLNRRGGRIFERVTGNHIGDQIAIVLDDQVFSAPTVQGRIGSRGQIEMGQAPLEEAQDLALVLRAGALPAPLQIMEQRSVGPALGADAVESGKIAGIIGVILVIAIMTFFYRLAGVLAIIALAGYMLLVLGGLAAFGAALTAPGIAGFLLSIGMGVDGNVLIFERIREELADGRAPRAAVDAGFQQAMSAIIDTHITTLMTALILYQIGTGPVQGFGVTLAVGILASFFSSVYVTRTLFLLYLERRPSSRPISI